MDEIPEGSILWVNSAHGVYVPKVFADNTEHNDISGVSAEDLAALSRGPAYEDAYWQTWEHVLDNARVTFGGAQYTLFQDGDLWLIPITTTTEETDNG